MARNVLGGELECCGSDPMTGFHRDGCCNTDAGDAGVHTVCAVVTAEFLRFSMAGLPKIMSTRLGISGR